MIIYETFEKELYDGLGRMYDPDFQPSPEIVQVLGCPMEGGSAEIRNRIQLAIEGLKPPADTPPATYIWSVYRLLYNRYCLKLTQEETAYQINVSRRTINRLQRNAIHILAGALWKQYQETGITDSSQSPKETGKLWAENPADSQKPDWNEQLQSEIRYLETTAPGALSNIKSVIQNAISIMSATRIGAEIQVKAVSIQPNLVAAVHPVMLEQVLISAIKRLAPHALNSEISIYARLEDGNAKITLTCPCGTMDWNERELRKDIPASKEINIELALEGHQAFMWITMPSLGKLTVLVVDDNQDMVQFYRDCTLGTRYHIQHLAHGRELSNVIHATKPDIIVLDVMLPDIDGWRLLMHIHDDPETRNIPVLVCSVIQEEDLALSLGAARYLAKPVSPHQFIEALDQLLPQAGTEDSLLPTKSEGSGQ
jgi:CheY-like chemotaxis protein/transcriptional regulator with XRE-family HTH domain